MIQEHPLANVLDLEVFESGNWVPYTGALTNVSIQRGGKRSGAVNTVDVGLLNATLINAGDPLNAGTLKPNMPVRVLSKAQGDPLIPAVTMYTQDFEANSTGWTAGTTNTITRSSGVGVAASWGLVTSRSTATAGQVQAKYTATGLTSGRSYTLSAWWANKDDNNVLNGKVGVTGKAYGTPVNPLFTVPYEKASYTFTATATSHELLLEHTAAGSPGFTFQTIGYWDDVTLLEDALPNPLYVPGEVFFTGRLVDLATSYRLDKSNGEKTTYVSISATDAVSSHNNSIRPGAYSGIAPYYETWAVRINRLDDSAVTAVNPPADDSPIVRYSI